MRQTVVGDNNNKEKSKKGKLLCAKKHTKKKKKKMLYSNYNEGKKLIWYKVGNIHDFFLYFNFVFLIVTNK